MRMLLQFSPDYLIKNGRHPTRGVYPDWRSRVEGLGDNVSVDKDHPISIVVRSLIRVA